MSEWNIGLRGHDVQAEDLPELSDKLKAYGIQNVQLVLKKSCQGFKEKMFTPSFAGQIGQIFAKNGVDISVLGCYINPSCTDEENLKAQTDYFIESLKYARYMNAGVVGLETGFVGNECIPENNHTEEAYRHLLKTMKYLRDNAEKLGVTVAVEAVSAFVIHSPERLLRLINDLDSPNIAVIFDLLNLLTMDNYREQEKIIDTMFQLLGDRIAVIHLKDFTVENGALRQCEIGKGICNIPYLLSILKERKPHIPVILEETKEDRLTDSVGFLKSVTL